MGRIQSSVGLISGLDIQNIVKQLVEIESRPLQLIQQRIEKTREQQSVYATIAEKLLAAKTSLGSLGQVSLFNRRSAVSSNPSVLSATAAGGASVGTTTFTVRSLVSTHQMVSGGLRDRTSAVGAGKLVFETARADMAPSTSLNVLNGGSGVRRGVIRITDRTGSSSDVDLTAAATINDVLEAINTQSSANVRARVDGGRLVIEDLSGGSTTGLRVMDVGGGYAAADLGIAGSSAAGTIAGRNLMSLTESTRLARLNDGIGVRFSDSAADLRFTLANGNSFDVGLTTNLSYGTHLAQLNDGHGVRSGTIRITNRAGESAEINLSGAQTIQDVKDAVEAANIGVRITSLTGAGIVLSDSTGRTSSNLKIEDVSGYAAADLGIVADVAASSVRGAGVYRMDTLGAVVKAIQYAAGNSGQLSVTLSDNSLVLQDNTAGGLPTTVTALNGSLAARDLGLLGGFDSTGRLASRDLIAGLNTVLLASLKGGSGLATGSLSFTLRDGTTIDGLNFSGAQTLADVLGVLNATGKLSARVDDGGTRIRVNDLTTGTGSFTAGGDMATGLGLVSAGDGKLVSDDLQLQYVAESTKLGDLNAGKGITYGSLRITTAGGVSRALTLTSSQHETFGDVINSINGLGIGVTARINANGDGIELQDTTTGSGRLTVAEEANGRTASDLGLLGTADGSGVLTGTLAKTIQVSAADTLESLVTKINNAGIHVTASLVNDGTPDNPYRLVLTSRSAGTQGRVTFSTDIPALSLDTLTKARDATVVVGERNSPNAVVVTSSSNTIKDLIPGLTLNLVGTSDQPMQVTVDRDDEAVVQTVKDFIAAFNDIMDLIDEVTRYDPNTQEKGILFGESTARQLQSRLFQMVTASLNKSGVSFSRLSDLGIMIDSSSGSARLTLERTLAGEGNTAGRTLNGEQRLRDALSRDPEGVKKLFSLVEAGEDGKAIYRGIAARLNRELTLMTTTGGLIPNENNRLQDRVDQFGRQVSSMQELLDHKEQRLYAQFQAMETALAGIQAQQSSLTSLAQLASSMAST
ncbi:MAG TPA: flagellar filament capping protein FliD [Phycisphaerae bacterium]|nr:flagellar filament capping protein FliD [Phycisphaerae bacterium]